MKYRLLLDIEAVEPMTALPRRDRIRRADAWPEESGTDFQSVFSEGSPVLHRFRNAHLPPAGRAAAGSRLHDSCSGPPRSFVQWMFSRRAPRPAIGNAPRNRPPADGTGAPLSPCPDRLQRGSALCGCCSGSTPAPDSLPSSDRDASATRCGRVGTAVPPTAPESDSIRSGTAPVSAPWLSTLRPYRRSVRLRRQS